VGRFLLGFFSVLLILALCLAGIWLGDLLGLINLDQVFLDLASSRPGLNDLAENYELGKKRSAVLKEREADLRARQRKLELAEAKLAEETSRFDQDQINRGKAGMTLPTKKDQPSGDSDQANLEKYLTLIGGMKPEKAAPVLQKLPDKTVYLILDKLRPNQAVKILEKLPAEYVARLTQGRISKKENI